MANSIAVYGGGRHKVHSVNTVHTEWPTASQYGGGEGGGGGGVVNMQPGRNRHYDSSFTLPFKAAWYVLCAINHFSGFISASSKHK